MDILPILATLKRHKTAAGLIVLQIALTCAIVCNALFMISERIATIQAPTYLADEELTVLSAYGMSRDANAQAQTQVDLARLQQIPGVKSVSISNQVMFGDNSNNSGIRLVPGENERSVLVASRYLVAEHWLPTTGLRLAEGRDFLPQEYVDDAAAEQWDAPVQAIIINQQTATRLFPGRSALGQTLYVNGQHPQQVVGVVADMIRPHPTPDAEDRFTMVLPIRPTYRSGFFLIRSAPEQRDAVLKAASQALSESGQGLKRIIRYQKTFSEMRSEFYRQDRSMVWLLGGVCAGLLVVTAFGIVGLASFWVQQRTRMIGTRRALGATRGQILRYFQVENFLLSCAGIVLGMVGAYGISLALMAQYEMPRLPWFYLPLGAVVLWALGQLAVLAPARRAARLPPVAALRAA